MGLTITVNNYDSFDIGYIGFMNFQLRRGGNKMSNFQCPQCGMVNIKNKILQFEPFKNAKKWDDEYVKFLGNTEKYFGAKINPEQMAKRLYFAMRYLSGVANSFWVCDKLGINLDNSEFEKGKIYCINWLEEILNKLKN